MLVGSPDFGGGAGIGVSSPDPARAPPKVGICIALGSPKIGPEAAPGNGPTVVDNKVVRGATAFDCDANSTREATTSGGDGAGVVPGLNDAGDESDRCALA